MSLIPAHLQLRIPQRATFRQRFRLPIDGTDIAVYAQMWDVHHSVCLIAFSVEWVSRLDPVDGSPTCVFDLVATPLQTATVAADGIWDLKVVIDPDVEEDYWFRGPAVLDPGITEDD